MLDVPAIGELPVLTTRVKTPKAEVLDLFKAETPSQAGTYVIDLTFTAPVKAIIGKNTSRSSPLSGPPELHHRTAIAIAHNDIIRVVYQQPDGIPVQLANKTCTRNTLGVEPVTSGDVGPHSSTERESITDEIPDVSIRTPLHRPPRRKMRLTPYSARAPRSRLQQLGRNLTQVITPPVLASVGLSMLLSNGLALIVYAFKEHKEKQQEKAIKIATVPITPPNAKGR